jgi:AraC family transcriptional regulator
MEYLANIQRAIDTIEANLRQPIAVEKIARRAGFSYWHFQRIFVALVGEPVGSYIRRRRLTAAAEELRTGRRRILDLALDYQFESHEAFTRAFHSVFHANPSDVRRRRHFIGGFARHQLTPDKLAHQARHSAMKPVILELPALILAGPAARFISAASPDANNLKIIPPLWHSLFARKGELGTPLDKYSYGACRCLSEAGRSREDELLYLAGVSIGPDTAVPPGMERWNVPAGTYAMFTHQGPVSRLSETINYAYGTWLPRSEFAPAEPWIELERYDARFRDGGPDSEMEYLVPVKRRP